MWDTPRGRDERMEEWCDGRTMIDFATIRPINLTHYAVNTPEAKVERIRR